MKLFIYFSDLIGMDVVDNHGQMIGRVHDLGLSLTSDIYPKTSALLISRGLLNKEYAKINWEDVLFIEEEVRLKVDVPAVIFGKEKINLDFSLRRDVLDQQVVDTDDQRVVRVNDVHLLRVENQLYAAHVDVGLRAIIRRLGWTDLVDFIIQRINPKAPYLRDEDLIGWKNTHILPKLGRMKSVLKLDVAKNKLSGIPPAAMADIIQDLDIFARLSLFKSLEASVQSKVFTDMAPEFKAEIIDQLDDPEAALLIQSIPADEATDLLLRLPRAKTHQLMRLMGSETSKKLRKLLAFAKDSAGGLMTTEYLWLKPDATVADAMQKLKDNVNFPGVLFFIYIVDDQHKFLGATSLRRFINEPLDKKLIETCYPGNISVFTDDSVEEVALLLEQHKFFAIPVLSHDEVLQGVITIDDVMEELIGLVWNKYKEKL